MGNHREIERKFLVKRIPREQKCKAAASIEQGYLSGRSRQLEIRLRRKDSGYYITFKSGRGLSRQEEEIKIPAARFRALWPLTRGARIAKRRYKMPWKKHTIELDVYQGRHRGLVTADVEFDSPNQARSFQPPGWLGREITGSRRYSNQRLARLHRLPRKAGS